ncbi:hypothetical protein MPER_10526, partial [Moniliophthora perniciosa FA553]
LCFNGLKRISECVLPSACVPWKLLSSSNKFTSYLSAYSVFLSSIAGVMITEYFLIRRGRYRVADLYHARRDGWYWYTYGINWRAYAAYIAGILINVVGFAGATGRTVPIAATRIYQMSFFTGCGVSSIIYFVLNAISPVPGASKKFKEVYLSGSESEEYEGSSIRESRSDTKSTKSV